MARQDVKNKNFDGIRSAAQMLAHLDKANRDRILKQLSEKDSELTKKIRNEMFLFEDISLLSGRDLQVFLREVSWSKLVLALRNTEESFRKVIFQNLSEGAAARLKEELESQGPQKLSIVQSAQQDILKLVKEMIESGKISLHRS